MPSEKGRALLSVPPNTRSIFTPGHRKFGTNASNSIKKAGSGNPDPAFYSNAPTVRPNTCELYFSFD